MDTQRIVRALKFRAAMWHKATSYRTKPDIKKFTRTDIVDGKPVTFTDVKAARQEASAATVKARLAFWIVATLASKALVDILAEETQDRRPEYVELAVHNNTQYRLAEVNGYNQFYDANADNLRVNKPVTRLQRIENELISAREWDAIDMLAEIIPNITIEAPNYK